MSCKKWCSNPTQDGQGEKVVKSRWWPRNGCDGPSMAKNFNNKQFK